MGYLNTLTLVQFDADSVTRPGEFAIQEREADGAFVGLYDFDGETIATRNSFPKASWSVVKELGESFDEEDFWSAIHSLNFCQDHLRELSERVIAVDGSDYCEYCKAKYETISA